MSEYEVNLYNLYINTLMSIHKGNIKIWNWNNIYNSRPPIRPKKNNFMKNTKRIEKKISLFKPTFFDKIFFLTNSKIKKLNQELSLIKSKDIKKYEKVLNNYEKDFNNWKIFNTLSKKILDKNINGYIEAINIIKPFYEISKLGEILNIKLTKEYSKIIVKVENEKIIPTKEKKLLKSGKLSEKNISKTRFYKLYKDYVCGVVLRIAREIFAILPIEIVFITVYTTLLNTKNGRMEEQPILSVNILKETMKTFNFEKLDPSDSMGNFIHNMNFKKTKGFLPIKELSTSQNILISKPEEKKKRKN